MIAPLTPGKYLVAVSGGVDSVALLHMLQGQPGVDLVVAHLDHGIREDSHRDRQLVVGLAQSYGLPYVVHEARLGPKVSEATARDVRYAFLRQKMYEHGARAIVTAHHQDDVLETAILNVLRGTHRKGLSSLRSTRDIVRPLLQVSKEALVQYAQDQGLVWHEDSTNMNDQYLRNYIRRHLVPRLGKEGRMQLLSYIAAAEVTNRELDGLLWQSLQQQPAADTLDRRWFMRLPYAVAAEVMAAWLRRLGVSGFDRKAIHRLVVAAMTANPGKAADVDAVHILRISRESLQIVPRRPS